MKKILNPEDSHRNLTQILRKNSTTNFLISEKPIKRFPTITLFYLFFSIEYTGRESTLGALSRLSTINPDRGILWKISTTELLLN